MKSSNSHIFKENNSIQASNAYLNTNNNNNLNIKNNFKNIKRKSLIIIENEEKKGFQEILLNQPNKSIVLIIKIFIIIIIIIFLLIFILSLFEFKIYLDLMLGFHGFFHNFTTVIQRFSLLNYYFNIFRTLIIFHDDELKNKIELELDNISQTFEEENDKYNKILLNEIPKYIYLKKLFNFLRDTQNNSTELIKEQICDNEQECINYLDSEYNIFNSGIDFSYQSCIIKIKNIYKDYKLLSNKTNIDLIKSKIINSSGNSFNHISLGICNLVLYIKSKIFQTFEYDQIVFRDSYNKYLLFLNIISIIFCIFTILFINIFIFFTISRFSRPIKESTYRLNCSFYYIKKYSLSNFRKSASFS